MINLSKKAAKRFNIRWLDLEDQSGDFWKIDVIMVSHYPVLLIVHEYTLYTLVRRKVNFKTIEDVVEEIKHFCPWYRCPKKLIIGKNTNKKLNGAITEMKRITAGTYYSDFTSEMEKRINMSIYSYLSAEKYNYGNPLKSIEKYKNGEMPWLSKIN